MVVIVTGCMGFIGQNFVKNWCLKSSEPLVGIDKLTYAAASGKQYDETEHSLHDFFQADIGNRSLVDSVLKAFSPRAIINLAAETHVDRSIRNPAEFIHSNIIGTANLLEAIRHYKYETKTSQHNLRLIHVSTDEVYGSLSNTDPSFLENSPCRPNSPYSASKASSDHLVHAWAKTFNMDAIVTRCSNNYGTYQYPEKLIPLVIKRALNLDPIPIYGDGGQVRDWIHVDDHCEALTCVLDRGARGEIYNIGANCEITNIDLVRRICGILDEVKPIPKKCSLREYSDLICHVEDRPGHDFRYSIDSAKMFHEFGWSARTDFDAGLKATVLAYVENIDRK